MAEGGVRPLVFNNPGKTKSSIWRSFGFAKELSELGDSASSVCVVNLDFRDTAISEYCGDRFAIVQGRLTRDEQFELRSNM